MKRFSEWAQKNESGGTDYPVDEYVDHWLRMPNRRPEIAKAIAGASARTIVYFTVALHQKAGAQEVARFAMLLP